MLGGGKAQTVEQRPGPGPGVVAPGIVEGLVRGRDPCPVAGRVGLGDRGLGRTQPLIAVQHVFDGRARQLGNLLAHVRHRPLGRNLHRSGIGLQLAEEQREQAGLAGTIRPDQPGLVPDMHHRRGFFQEHLGAAAKRDVVELDHGRGE